MSHEHTDSPGEGPTESELNAWLDGELAPEAAQRIERHVAASPALQERLADYARNDDLLRTAFATVETVSPAPALDALADRIARRSAVRRVRGPALAVAASLAAFVLGAATYPSLQPFMPWSVPAVVETAARAHGIFEATSAVEVPGTRQRELTARVERHLGMPVTVPDLAGIGYRLVGGRLLTSDEGPLAQFVYEDARAARLTVYVSGSESVGTEDIKVVEVDELLAGYWQAEDLAYSVVADTDDETLRRVAVEISAAVGGPQS